MSRKLGIEASRFGEIEALTQGVQALRLAGGSRLELIARYDLGRSTEVGHAWDPASCILHDATSLSG
eukprot:7379386-Prymnesium_polylepis.1